MNYDQEAAELLDRVSFTRAIQELILVWSKEEKDGQKYLDNTQKALSAFLEYLDGVRKTKFQYKQPEGIEKVIQENSHIPKEYKERIDSRPDETATEYQLRISKEKPKRGRPKGSTNKAKASKPQLPEESEPGQPMTPEEKAHYKALDRKLQASAPDRDAIMASVIAEIIKPGLARGQREFAIPRMHNGNTISLSPTFWRNSLKLNKVSCNDVDFTYDAKMWRGPRVTSEYFPLTLI